MPAPYKKRKSNRQSSTDPSSNGENRSQHGKRNLGRRELRTVTRTSRRDLPDAQNHEEVSQQDEVDSDASEEEAGTSSQVEHDRTQSYNALLTLLAADHKSDEPKSNKKRTSSKRTEDEKVEAIEEEEEDDDEKEEEEEEEDTVAGVNFGKEEDDQDEPADSDIDEDEAPQAALSDPFENHFNQVSDSYVDSQEKLIVKEKQRWPITKKQPLSQLGYTSFYQSPPGEPLGQLNAPHDTLKQYNIKNRMIDAYEQQFKTIDLSGVDKELANPIFNYQDVNFPYKSYTHNSYQKLYLLHALNHIFKTRDRVIKNNEKLHKYHSALKEGKVTLNDEPELRDQGFTRPKVLILLPTRNACYEVVNLLIKLLGAEQQENKKKFQTQFYSPELPPETKPDDFRDTFKGNNNDFFSIGLKFTRKTLRLYSSFYASDIILASPIGLSMILESPDKRKREYDFLSSIEVLIIDKANSIEMQNWDHVVTVLKYTNKIPKDFHDADFSRIRMWSINDQAKLLRQTLVFSEYLTPNINNLITGKSSNVAGKWKYKPIVTLQNCIMNSIGLQIKQIFQRFDGGATPVDNPEARFKYFINTVLPNLTKSMSYDNGLLIYIASYYDYLRVKNYMKSLTKFTFEAIDEYSEQSKLSRTRTYFQQGKVKIVLYTERLHHFRRFDIAGVKNVLVYEAPSNPIFYKELIRFIGKSVFRNEADLDLSFIKVLFSKWDAVSLERIVGGERAPILCNSVNEMFEFR